jgi:hypothetical protein
MTMARSEGLAGLESSPKDTPSAGRLKTNRADSTLVLNDLDVVALGQHRGRPVRTWQRQEAPSFRFGDSKRTVINISVLAFADLLIQRGYPV